MSVVESFRVPATSFRDRNNWSGGHYQLALELGERDDDVVDRAFRALWAAARVALAETARQVHKVTPFRLGLIGCEVSGTASAVQLAGTAPSERAMGYLIPRGRELAFFAATQ